MPLSLLRRTCFLKLRLDHVIFPRRLLFVSRCQWSDGNPLNVEPKAKATVPFQEASTAPEETLPQLSRPLGVRERPTTVIKTQTQRMKDLMDQDVRLAQRRHLIKEASKGYFHDLNMTRKHGGKTWTAPNVLIREDKALYFPNIYGRRLDDNEVDHTTTMCFGRISLVSMLGTQISQIHSQSFTDRAHARFSSNPLYQHILINVQENMLKAFLVKIFSRSLRATVLEELHHTYLISSQNLEYLRDPLGMTNSKVGYVYLVDENLKVRWGGCADATAEEAQGLETCVGVLLARLQRAKDARVKTEGSPVSKPEKT